MKRISKIIGTSLLFFFLGLGAIIAMTIIAMGIFTKPSNERNWVEDQKILPYAEIDNNLVTIRNIRNFSYEAPRVFRADYYDKTFDLNKLTRAWFIVSPFSGIPGSAHTFLSFEFEDDQFISISVEVRKEEGEAFHPIKGMFNNYEITYIISDERDVLKLRSNYQKDLTYVYPIKTSTTTARALFLDMIARANELKDTPEFYNILTNTCTTNIAKHVNTIIPKRVPFLDLRLLFPANADELAYELGLIDTDLPFAQAREKYLINDRALKYADDPDFSRRIRE